MNVFKGIVLFAAFWVAALSNPLFAKPVVIKFATLAPEGSTWMKVMEDWNRELIEKSEGRLKFRFYSGGVSGDEKDVVRKIRLGQLHAGGFTGVGLGVIAPKVRLLDAPFLFRTVEEVDHITELYKEVWAGAFKKKGYLLLGWADVGFVYFFTKVPVKNLFELKGIKMWMWEGDPIAEAAFKTLGVSPIPLSITDVMTSIQTGLIDGVYSSPLGLIVLQWFTRTKHMYNFQLAYASGAVLISRRFFDKMPEDLQTLLLETGRRHLKRLTELSRKENRESIAVLKKSGIRVTSPVSSEEIEGYEALGRKARRLLVKRLYPESLLNDVEAALEKFRDGKKKK